MSNFVPLMKVGILSPSSQNKQVLDTLPIEKERGITVKAQTASFVYSMPGDKDKYLLNLIDTPGHVDFSYEVSRSLAACEGVLLVVDATQGIQAQTMAHACLALDMGLTVVPVINKVDLAHADVPKTIAELKTVFGDLIVPDDVTDDYVLQISAKSGLNVEKVLEAIIKRIPGPSGMKGETTRALLFDSWYDTYRGVISLVSVKQGTLSKNDIVSSWHSKRNYEILQLGLVTPSLVETDSLEAGQVGYVILNIKNPRDAHIGDTLFLKKDCDKIGEPSLQKLVLPGFQKVQPMVYAGLFPVDTNDFEHLRDALDKLLLNDSSVTCQRTSSSALGLGFRLGFLGVLHMDVFRQRLEEEYDADIILTNPAVPYKLNYEDESVIIENPSDYNPHDAKLVSVEEPFVMSRMMVPKDYLGNVMSLCEKRRGTLVDTEFISEMRVVLKYELPLAEVAENGFFNELKQVTSGYASLDYEDPVFKESKISKLDVLINREPVDALSYLTHASEAQDRAGSLARSLKSLIRRQQFEIAIQVQANGKVMARETIQAYRKDVTAKLYGGDQTRKRKLLDKQKEGKKRMKMIGKVELDKEVFLNINKR